MLKYIDLHTSLKWDQAGNPTLKTFCISHFTCNLIESSQTARLVYYLHLADEKLQTQRYSGTTNPESHRSEWQSLESAIQTLPTSQP